MHRTTVTVPGGTATLRDPREITARHSRPLKTVMMTLAGKFSAIVGSQAVQDAQQTGQNDPAAMAALVAEMNLTEAEATALERMSDATVYKWLHSWTLDLPLPTSIDDLLDLPDVIRDPLVEAASQAEAANQDVESGRAFTVEAVEDTSSPTGASAD